MNVCKSCPVDASQSKILRSREPVAKNGPDDVPWVYATLNQYREGNDSNNEAGSATDCLETGSPQRP